MKLSLVSFLLSAALVAGCASHSATPRAAAPAAPAAPVATAAPLPPPVEVAPEPESKGPEMTADGRVRVKGDVWELDVANPDIWVPRHSQFEFAMVSPDKKIIVLLQRQDWVDTQAKFDAKMTADLTKAGGHAVPGSKKTVTLNGHKATLQVLIINDVTVMNWNFTTGAEGFSLGCGTPSESFKENKAICQDLADHFTLGASPQSK